MNRESASLLMMGIESYSNCGGIGVVIVVTAMLSIWVGQAWWSVAYEKR
jgi:hypothetical protein